MKLLPAFLLFLSLRLRALAAGEVSMELVTEHLPTIDKLLEELELTHLAEKFYSSGFTETQYILRMKDMDLRIMAMEWGVDKDQIMRVKEAIQNYKIEREVVEVVEDPLLKERNGLKYGKLVVNRSTTSYEYFTAYFSAPMPLTFMPIAFAADESACNLSGTANASGTMLFATRGGCSFLDKAMNASTADASALIIANNGSNLFHIAAGYATGSDFVEDTDVPQNLPMIMVKHHATMALQLGIANVPIEGRMVPLKCQSGETQCFPILPEEKDIPLEVDSGYIAVEELGERFEFLSGTWGGILPDRSSPVVAVEPFDGCSAATNSAALRGAIAVVKRGMCGFGDKAVNVQAAGASALLIVDNPGSSLMRIGATSLQMGSIGIPGMLVSKTSGDRLLSKTGMSASIIMRPGMADAWLELGLTQWPEKENEFNVVYRQLRQRNSDSTERVAWLDDQHAARFPVKKASDEL
jgi:hypothetical protein